MESVAAFRLGFDIGGTFTDFVLVDERTGDVYLNKRLTTPRAPAEAVMDGLGVLFEKAGVSGADVAIAIHATTLVTNALIERKGARTALVTTEGFRDVPEMGSEVRYDIYDLALRKPDPLVPRMHRYEARERMDHAGRVLTPLDENKLRAVAAQIRAQNINSIAIAFLHSFRNAAHETRAAEILQEELPDVSISLSSLVAPEIREYERMSTTIANAYVKPLTKRYVDVVEQGLRLKDYARPLFLMLSSGGVATAHTARDLPIRIVESGPAAGVLAAIYFGRRIGIDDLVTFDMGGTTAKIGLVRDGRAAKANMIEVDRVERFKKGSGIPVKTPIIELIEIGAGGGSIAHIDALGLMKVGPQSSGAEPGPVCYGRGGTTPTVTDSNVLLGYLSPDFFLGGAMKLDEHAARRAFDVLIARPLGLSVDQAARGVVEVVNRNMLSAAKVHIAERGEDPRRFYLFAFGGAGPMHAYELARLLGMKGVIVPPGAGATSAMGLVTSAVSFELGRSYLGRLDSIDWHDLRVTFDAMIDEGRRVLREAGVDPDGTDVSITRSMDLRHKGQGHEVPVEVPAKLIADEGAPAIADLFFDAHAKRYGHAHRDLAVELITCRVSISGPSPDIPLVAGPSGTVDPAMARKGERDAYFFETASVMATPVYDRYRLAPGMTFQGPALIEERECTIVAGPSAHVRVDPYGAIFIDVGKE